MSNIIDDAIEGIAATARSHAEDREAHTVRCCIEVSGIVRVVRVTYKGKHRCHVERRHGWDAMGNPVWRGYTPGCAIERHDQGTAIEWLYNRVRELEGRVFELEREVAESLPDGRSAEERYG